MIEPVPQTKAAGSGSDGRHGDQRFGSNLIARRANDKRLDFRDLQRTGACPAAFYCLGKRGVGCNAAPVEENCVCSWLSISHQKA